MISIFNTNSTLVDGNKHKRTSDTLYHLEHHVIDQAETRRRVAQLAEMEETGSAVVTGAATYYTPQQDNHRTTITIHYNNTTSMLLCKYMGIKRHAICLAVHATGNWTLIGRTRWRPSA